jgi:hypothetical protein
MPATAPAPSAERERLEIIWRTITRDVQRFVDESGIGTVNSKRWVRIDRTLEELAAMLVDEVSEWSYATGEDEFNEVGELSFVTEEIWRFIETKLIDYALDVEARRAARRSGAAA